MKISKQQNKERNLKKGDKDTLSFVYKVNDLFAPIHKEYTHIPCGYFPQIVASEKVRNASLKAEVTETLSEKKKAAINQ